MIAAEMVARGGAAARFRAGHTGATVMPASSALSMLPGADRPVLAATIPARRHRAVVLDAGASAGRPLHLLQFVVIGGVYARVALLSIGEEETRRHELPREIAAAAVGLRH